MDVATLLSVPFVRSAMSVFDQETGTWRRRLAYDDLDGCRVDALSLVAGLQALELTRVGLLLRAVAAGEPPQTLRPPLKSVDVRADLSALGLQLTDHVLGLPLTAAGGNDELDEVCGQALSEAARLCDVPSWEQVA